MAITDHWAPEDTFAMRLRAIRRHLGLSQEEAATRCTINPKTWASWELGASPRNMATAVRRISEGLKDDQGRSVDPNYLMWGSAFGYMWQEPAQAPNPRQGRLFAVR